jgi:tyrosinase
MSSFATAALDPLFWLHHANIDRLWRVWNLRRSTNTNPTQSQWLNSPAFEFHDASGAVVALTSVAMVDSEASPFRYRYEDESDPLGSPAEEISEVEEDTSFMDQPPAEMIGATESGTTLAGGAVTAHVLLQPPTGPALEVEADVAPGRIHLNLENITGDEPVPHLVYINLPEGADPADHPERLAGSLPMFGLSEASGADSAHPGSGLHYSLDITPVVERLGDNWSFDEMDVTLVPRTGGGQAAEEIEEIESEPSPITIGRISLYLGQ